MGCSSSHDDIDNSSANLRAWKVKDRILELIKLNPFYNLSLKQFKKLMNNYPDPNNIDLEAMITSIQESIFLSKKKTQKKLFHDVIIISFSKFHKIFPKEPDINKTTFHLLYFFLTEKDKDKKKAFRKNLSQLFSKIMILINKDKEEDKNIISNNNEKEYLVMTGRFSFLILNLMQFCTYSYIYLFCAPPVLEIMGEIKKDKIEKMIFGEEDKNEKEINVKNINNLFNKCLFSINDALKPNIVNSLFLTDILQPISDHIRTYPNDKKFIIKKNELDKIIDLIMEKMDVEFFMRFFFSKLRKK